MYSLYEYLECCSPRWWMALQFRPCSFFGSCKN